MHTFISLVLCWLAVSGIADDSDKSGKAELKEKLKQAEARTQKLTADLKHAEANLNKKANDASASFSLTGAIASTGRVAADVFQHALDQTDLDDKVATAASSGYGSARAFVVDFVGKAVEVDYSGHLSKLQSHDLYVKHVAPAVEAIKKQAEPHLEKARIQEHVNLAHAKIREVVDPAVSTARAKAGEVLPAVQQLKDKMLAQASAVPEHFSLLEDKVGKVIAPAFEFAAKASPEHAKSLPTATLDRVLYLVVLFVVSYYVFLFFAKFVLMTTLRISTKVTSVFLKLLVVLPLKIILRLVNLALWFSTCFYCCGLCRRKSKPIETQDAKQKEQKAAKAGKKEKATVEEVQQLLEASKKKGKLDDAVKLLCAKEKECKPLEGKAFPENVRGKIVDKEILKKAFGKFKEIDMKKL
jgi:hypothetical protein